MHSKSLLKALFLAVTSLLLINDSFSIETSSKVTNYVQGEAVASERSYLRNIGSSSNNEESRKLEDEMGLEGVGVFAGTLRLVGILIFAPVWITFKMVEGVGDVINITQEQMVAAYDFYFRTVIASIIGGSD